MLRNLYLIDNNKNIVNRASKFLFLFITLSIVKIN